MDDLFSMQEAHTHTHTNKIKIKSKMVPLTSEPDAETSATDLKSGQISSKL